MKNPRLFAFLAFVLLPSAILSAAPTAPLSFLHTQGQDMVDESGKKVLLRGVGLGNWMLPEGYMWKFGEQGDRPRKIEKLVSELIGQDKASQFWSEFRKNYITEADIARISGLGFNSVRPALNARLFLSESEKAEYVQEGFELLSNLVAWCRKYHVYVIIDMHGAPGGQTGQNIDDSANDQPELFMDRQNQDRLVNLWVKIATQLKDEPTVAAYDLLNEPLPRRTGAEEKYKSQLEPLYKRITAAVREVDKKHMITVEGADWANDWSVFTAPFDSNLFYQFHFYCWERPTKLNRIDQYLNYRQRLQTPVWVGETGEKDSTIYWATMDYFEANNIGWSFWPWKKMDTVNTPYSIKLPEGWRDIVGYSRANEKPTRDVAQRAFDQLLQNIRLENCTYFPEVVNALFRKVPGKVQAENYGHEGANVSYSVQHSATNSKLYRTSEPVEIVAVQEPGRRNAGQAIQLHAQEWTTYLINSDAARNYTVTCRAKADEPSTVIEVSLEGNRQEASLDPDWNETGLKPISLKMGANRLKIVVKSGMATIDWLSFN